MDIFKVVADKYLNRVFPFYYRSYFIFTFTSRRLQRLKITHLYFSRDNLYSLGSRRHPLQLVHPDHDHPGNQEVQECVQKHLDDCFHSLSDRLRLGNNKSHFQKVDLIYYLVRLLQFFT